MCALGIFGKTSIWLINTSELLNDSNLNLEVSTIHLIVRKLGDMLLIVGYLVQIKSQGLFEMKMLLLLHVLNFKSNGNKSFSSYGKRYMNSFSYANPSVADKTKHIASQELEDRMLFQTDCSIFQFGVRRSIRFTPI